MPWRNWLGFFFFVKLNHQDSGGCWCQHVHVQTVRVQIYSTSSTLSELTSSSSPFKERESRVEHRRWLACYPCILRLLYTRLMCTWEACRNSLFSHDDCTMFQFAIPTTCRPSYASICVAHHLHARRIFSWTTLVLWFAVLVREKGSGKKNREI